MIALWRLQKVYMRKHDCDDDNYDDENFMKHEHSHATGSDSKTNSDNSKKANKLVKRRFSKIRTFLSTNFV